MSTESQFYFQVEEGSQYYTDLQQLLQKMKNLKVLAVRLPPVNKIVYAEIDYIIKGLENSIEDGWFMDNINYLEKT